jgi:hypothetical protein
MLNVEQVIDDTNRRECEGDGKAKGDERANGHGLK